MKIVLLRHGATSGNLNKKYIGRTDEPLCSEGVLQAKSAGMLPDVKRVFVSPMLRARQTASLCFPNAEQIIVDDVRGMDFGDFEGRSADEMLDDASYISWVAGYCSGRCPNGEDMQEYQSRTLNAFDNLVNNAMTCRDDIMYIVAHGGTVMAIMNHFVVSQNQYFDWRVPNCCGYSFQIEKTNPNQSPYISSYRYYDKLTDI